VLPFAAFHANIIEVEVDACGVKMPEDHFPAVGLPDAAVRERSRQHHEPSRPLHYCVSAL
jgi:hypothetical protein